MLIWISDPKIPTMDLLCQTVRVRYVDTLSINYAVSLRTTEQEKRKITTEVLLHIWVCNCYTFIKVDWLSTETVYEKYQNPTKPFILNPFKKCPLLIDSSVDSDLKHSQTGPNVNTLIRKLLIC